MIEHSDRDNRITSGEGPSPGPGAGLEYDLWEGQFQFVGQTPSSRVSRLPRRCGRLTEQVRFADSWNYYIHAMIIFSL